MFSKLKQTPSSPSSPSKPSDANPTVSSDHKASHSIARRASSRLTRSLSSRSILELSRLRLSDAQHAQPPPKREPSAGTRAKLQRTPSRRKLTQRHQPAVEPTSAYDPFLEYHPASRASSSETGSLTRSARKSIASSLA